MLASIKLKIGFAFGLFAVFSIIRYRTEQIPIREMTYLFTVIILAVLNALSTGSLSYAELLLANTAVLVTVFLLEKNFLYNRELVQRITYEKIELIKPENYSRLIADLKERTGLDVIRVEIDTINFLNDTAKLKMLYHSPDTRASEKEQ
jgi:Ca2+/Na+ antiporter